MSTVHIEASRENIAKTVLMPGDPKRAEYIAKKFLDKVELVNVIRGMTAYTGYYKNKMVTIFPSGMGMPSMGIYSYELFNFYDVDNIIRIGSCGSYVPECSLNDTVLVTYSCSDSNYAKIMDNYEYNYVMSNQELNNIIEDTANGLGIKLVKGNIFSSDVFYQKTDNSQWRQEQYKVLGVEMESFALFTNARIFNKKASCLLTVSDTLFDDKELSAKEREQHLDNMIIIALESSLKI